MQSAASLPSFANTSLFLQQVQKLAHHSNSKHPGKEFQSTASLLSVIYMNKGKKKKVGTSQKLQLLFFQILAKCHSLLQCYTFGFFFNSIVLTG